MMDWEKYEAEQIEKQLAYYESHVAKHEAEQIEKELADYELHRDEYEADMELTSDYMDLVDADSEEYTKYIAKLEMEEESEVFPQED